MSVPILRIQKFTRQPLTPLGARKPKRFHFRIVAENGEIVCASEAYTTARARNKTAALIASAKFKVL